MKQPAVRDELRRVVAFRLGLVGWPNVAPHDVALVEATLTRLRAVHASDERALEVMVAAAPGAESLERTLSNSSLGETRRSGDALEPVPELEDAQLPVETPGRYEVLREIGTGGLGRVLLVRDLATAREVALKELHGEPSGRESDTQQSMTSAARFLREARITAQLEHPGIVPVYEVGRRKDGSLYYTMRRIEGRTLADALAHAGSLDARLRLLPSLLTVARAVAYAHERQVLHRDIKPQNVMLGRYGEASLLDWGLARVKPAARASRKLAAAPDITGARSTAVGTPAYMSPEQARGATDELDERTDVWGLGGLLFELLTGRSPFVGTSALEVLSRIVNERVEPPGQLEPDAPDELCAICEKALSPQPEDRYPDARAFADDVQAWLDRRTVSAKRYSGRERLALFVRRNKAPVLVGALGLLLAVGVALSALVTVRRQRNEARTFATSLLRDTTAVLRDTPYARQQLQDVTTRALGFLEGTDARGLPRDEQALLADAWLVLSDLNLERSRFDEATRFVDACAAVATVLPAPLDGLDSALVQARCGLLRFRFALARDDRAAMQRAYDEGLALLKPQGPWVGEPAWLDVSAELADSLYRIAVADYDGPEAALLRTVSREHSEKLVALQPGQPRATLRLARSLTNEQLQVWRPGAEAQAEALGVRAIALLEGLLETPSSFPALELLSQQLRQHVMLLQWGDTPERAEPFIAAARTRFEALLALDPANRPLRAEYADLLLLAGEPAEALAQLERLPDDALVGDYLVSYLLAALLADRDDAVEKRRGAIATSDEPQVHWLEALYLAQRGQLAEASALVHAWAGRAASAQVIWPLRRFEVLALRAPAEAGPALRTFVTCMDTGVRTLAESPTCYGALADDLDAAVKERSTKAP
ncbi:MAG: protein kinase [Myxococcaceae bacterium]|nr:protein kinase [Myxococcaceae bacterium]